MVLTLSFNKGPLHHQKSENSWKYTIDFKHYIWDKVFKSGLSKFFKGCLPQDLTKSTLENFGPFQYTKSHLKNLLGYKDYVANLNHQISSCNRMVMFNIISAR